jgi:hypothetical protein
VSNGPTSSREIRVFGKIHTEYIPFTVAELVPPTCRFSSSISSSMWLTSAESASAKVGRPRFEIVGVAPPPAATALSSLVFGALRRAS